MLAARKTIIAWVAVYLLLTGGLGWWLFSVRTTQLELANRPEVRAEWERWKEEVERQNAAPSQPVSRRTPTTAEPPSLILLRDNFPAVCGTLALVWTAFFGFLAMVITGVARGGRSSATER